MGPVAGTARRLAWREDSMLEVESRKDLVDVAGGSVSNLKYSFSMKRAEFGERQRIQI